MANRARSSDLILAQTAICRLRPPLQEGEAGVEGGPRSLVPRAFTRGADFSHVPAESVGSRDLLIRAVAAIPPSRARGDYQHVARAPDDCSHRRPALSARPRGLRNGRLRHRAKLLQAAGGEHGARGRRRMREEERAVEGPPSRRLRSPDRPAPRPRESCSEASSRASPGVAFRSTTWTFEKLHELYGDPPLADTWSPTTAGAFGRWSPSGRWTRPHSSTGSTASSPRPERPWWLLFSSRSTRCVSSEAGSASRFW